MAETQPSAPATAETQAPLATTAPAAEPVSEAPQKSGGAMPLAVGAGGLAVGGLASTLGYGKFGLDLEKIGDQQNKLEVTRKEPLELLRNTERAINNGGTVADIGTAVDKNRQAALKLSELDGAAEKLGNKAAKATEYANAKWAKPWVAVKNAPVPVKLAMAAGTIATGIGAFALAKHLTKENSHVADLEAQRNTAQSQAPARA